MSRMFDNERYADCTVRVGPAATCETFRANRTLLARCSDVFGKMFFEQRMQEECSAEVHIPDTTGEAFKELIRCSHDLEPEIHAINFVDVFRLAQKYDVEELRDAVIDWLKDSLAKPALALRALDAAEARGVTVRAGGAPAGGKAAAAEDVFLGDAMEDELSRMLDSCLQTVVAQAEVLLDAGALFGCSAATVALLVQQENLCCDEEHLWCNLMHWAEDQDGKETLRAVAPYVRFNIMSSEFFVDEVVPTGVLEPREVVELLSSRATGRPTASFPDALLHRNVQMRSRWTEAVEEDEYYDSEGEDDLVSARGAPGRLQRVASSTSDAGGGFTGRGSGSTTPSMPPLGQLQVDLHAAAPPGAGGYPAMGDSRQASSRRRKLRDAREAHRAGGAGSALAPPGALTLASAGGGAALAARRTSKLGAAYGATRHGLV